MWRWTARPAGGPAADAAGLGFGGGDRRTTGAALSPWQDPWSLRLAIGATAELSRRRQVAGAYRERLAGDRVLGPILGRRLAGSQLDYVALVGTYARLFRQYSPDGKTESGPPA